MSFSEVRSSISIASIQKILMRNVLLLINTLEIVTFAFHFLVEDYPPNCASNLLVK